MHAIQTPPLPTSARSEAARPGYRPWWPAVLFLAVGIACYLAVMLLPHVPPSFPSMPLIMASMWGPDLCVILLGLWWLVLGPAPWSVRWRLALAVAVLVQVGMVAAHPSARFFAAVWGVPLMVAVLTVALLVLGWAPSVVRTSVAVLLALGAMLFWDVVRVDGVTGIFQPDFASRWSPTAEEQVRLYEEQGGALVGEAPEAVGPADATAEDWPGFRGARRDGVAPGLPGGASLTLKEEWRHPVGPAWSSVCAVDDRIYTLEQRGEDELVVCYEAATGKPVWSYRQKARHEDQMSGAGPRSTPTFHQGKIYALGAKGNLVCLEAGTGIPVWEENLAEKYGCTPPLFGMSSSPLVTGGRVYVHPGGDEGPRLLALEAATGAKVWIEGESKHGYSSPVLATVAGRPQLLVFNGLGLFGHDPATGKQLGHYEWVADQTANAVVQPLVLSGDRVVLGGGRVGIGTRCVKLTPDGDGWSSELVWETTKASPGFNDVVLHQGHLYGLDSGRLFCLNADTGEARWKMGGRFGAGQVLLVGNELVVQAEEGRLALVPPTPESAPKARWVEALKDKTWNHPAAARGRLFVRNGRELVCFRMAGAER